MKILIITQAIDLDDPTLSVYHNWVEAIALRGEKATLLCLKKGRNTFPQSIEVLSLGKESHPSHLSYIAKFFSYIWTRRHEYDAVFVHMNQEYVLLGGWLWKLLGKRVYLWRNHYAGTLLTDIAAGFCTKVFYTSNNSYTAKLGNAVRMPVGVPLETFARMPNVERKPRSLLSLGRIAPSKNTHLFVEALGILKKENITCTASIYGSALPTDAAYEAALHVRVKELGLGEAVRFYPGISNDKTPPIYNAHEIFVNVSPQGMFDKTILEAAACGCVVVTANTDTAEFIDAQHIIKSLDADHIARGLAHALTHEGTEETITKQQEFVRQNSLTALSQKLMMEMTI